MAVADRLDDVGLISTQSPHRQRTLNKAGVAASAVGWRVPMATTLLSLSAVLLGLAIVSGVRSAACRHSGARAAATATLSGAAAIACIAVLLVAATHA